MDDYSEYREKWKHEDRLINQRLKWLLLIQTILFAGYANIAMKLPEVCDTFLIVNATLLILMAVFGILFTCIIRKSINAAIEAMHDLKKQYQGHKNIDSYSGVTEKGFNAPRCMTKLFIYLWSILLVLSLTFFLFQYNF